MERGHGGRDQAGRDLILKCAPIRTDEGAFAGTVATLTDITVIRQAERKREETLRFISHDMRAPQNSILALVAMNQDSLNGVQQSDALARIAMLANRTLRLVDDFVHLTRAESMKIAPTELDLSELLREATDDFWAPARARHPHRDRRTPAHRPGARRRHLAAAGPEQPAGQRHQIQSVRWPYPLHGRA